ncbi:EAL domain-containing protein [Herbaspirillum sp. RTI4]|uniref:bifunctional diguanylate cyclase/phosphodiesterase n=1 Tax=Herbaspirillum sp. RTI4 TaxID=3048640 RepID=UPI002AB56B55|nr:EAL domain-containing protein [Herbaspirillum sp. RTI4]MDY7578900.1 EAL domain-containing protein [Herbaspirillum sp. RTI4]MEA9981989.1 EAL domain-containing protein [Herbaspirillum sp. RTI4]
MRSLQSRIVALFTLLILLVQLAGFFVIRSAIEANARTSIQENLIVGEKVFMRLLDQNAQKLTLGARLLAADFGFRQAIASDDRETIQSVLTNHGARIGASLAMLIGTDQKIKASTLNASMPDLESSSLELVEKAGEGSITSDFAVVDQRIYQLVAVPVKAPLTIAWVVMGFPIDNSLISDMKALSSLQVTLLVRDADKNWVPDVSTMSAEAESMLAKHLQDKSNAAFMRELEIDGNQYSARRLTLIQTPKHSAVVVLQRSISEAIAPYRLLQFNLLMLTIAGVIVAVIASMLTAKHLTSPLRALADTAKRLGEGDYLAKIAVKREGEIGKLADSFEHMRDGIAQRELEIRRLAYWDALTGLPNRTQFANLLQSAIDKAKETGQQCYVLMLDLDRFQHVNDTLGHTLGDLLLQQLGARIREQLVRDTYHVARLGGDEFAVLLPDTELAGARIQALRILESLELPLSLEDHKVDLGAGIGIAGYPEHGADTDTLLSHAEMAMYNAKRAGTGVVVYETALNRSSQESLSLLSELRRALDRDEFQLYLQPKVALASGKVVGAEALIRWLHPTKGLLPPDSFIPFAETTGFIRQMTVQIFNRTAAICAQLTGQGIVLKYSVNLSARDLHDQELPVILGNILQEHGVSASAFCLEITESSIMDDPAHAQLTLERLHNMGLDLSIDDFGTGYSSLAYLKRLPDDELKIDKSFVLNMEQDADDAKIVKSTFDLGHNLGLRVVAEGIESEAVWHLLSAMGCDQAQGYFISKPMPAAAFQGWLAGWQAPGGSAISVKGTA